MHEIHILVFFFGWPSRTGSGPHFWEVLAPFWLHFGSLRDSILTSVTIFLTVSFRGVFGWRFLTCFHVFMRKGGSPGPGKPVKSHFGCFWCRAKVQKRSDFDGFWDRFGVPAGSFFGFVLIKMVTFLYAFWETPSGEALGPVLEPKQ